ncbi:hypothetical protein OG858_47000 (plasmid) [Streptomyces europaeiscabiei]|uniref:hypothetical protein n=1 Tax=Streptomyces europaeiscabiei TaxID=146819 RepID=UPI002E801381|nr:hypothetical protein [Streptomyces europaeiscabiei]WUD38858.1 hypothetical protein OG858_47000 [Streptomyces europaeiscabiei]
MIYAVPIAVFGARTQSKLIAPSVAEASIEDAPPSRERQEVKRGAEVRSLTALYAMLAATIVLLLAAVVSVAYLVLDRSIFMSLSVALSSVAGMAFTLLIYLYRLRSDRN